MLRNQKRANARSLLDDYFGMPNQISCSISKSVALLLSEYLDNGRNIQIYWLILTSLAKVDMKYGQASIANIER